MENAVPLLNKLDVVTVIDWITCMRDSDRENRLQ